MSCLFNSISYFINDSSNNIRQKICKYLEDNNPIINGLDTKTILNIENVNYINNMKRQNTLGGAIEIQCACNIWNLCIIVKNIQNKNHTNIQFLPINNNYNRTIYISWSGNHYEPIKL